MSHGFWWIALILSTLALCVYFTLIYWQFLHDGTDSLSTSIRNVSLIIGGIIAMELALWRSFVSVRQVNTAQRSLLDERFQKGAEMLGSEDLSVRLGGIYALQRLAEEQPEIYHVQVMELLCAFVRHPTKDQGLTDGVYIDEEVPRADVTAVVEIVCKRNRAQIQAERNAEFSLDLSKADLSYFDFGNTDLSGAKFYGARLYKTSFAKANMSNAHFADAMFSDVWPRTIRDSTMDREYKPISHANLREADLSGTSFSLQKGSRPAKGLMQRKLNEACADPDKEPKVEGVYDVETRSPIVWGGIACEKE